MKLVNALYQIGPISTAMGVLAIICGGVWMPVLKNKREVALIQLRSERWSKTDRNVNFLFDK